MFEARFEVAALFGSHIDFRVDDANVLRGAFEVARQALKLRLAGGGGLLVLPEFLVELRRFAFERIALLFGLRKLRGDALVFDGERFGAGAQFLDLALQSEQRGVFLPGLCAGDDVATVGDLFAFVSDIDYGWVFDR